MQNWEFLPLMAAGMGLLFCTLHYFGLMVVKSGTYTGFATGTPTSFWGGVPVSVRLRLQEFPGFLKAYHPHCPAGGPFRQRQHRGSGPQ